jgi:hypothetical protein
LNKTNLKVAEQSKSLGKGMDLSLHQEDYKEKEGIKGSLDPEADQGASIIRKNLLKNQVPRKSLFNKRVNHFKKIVPPKV